MDETHGGAREGAGRKSKLRNPKRFLIILEPKHAKMLAVLSRRLKRDRKFLTAGGKPRLPSRSEALRYLLEGTKNAKNL